RDSMKLLASHRALLLPEHRGGNDAGAESHDVPQKADSCPWQLCVGPGARSAGSANARARLPQDCSRRTAVSPMYCAYMTHVAQPSKPRYGTQPWTTKCNAHTKANAPKTEDGIDISR